MSDHKAERLLKTKDSQVFFRYGPITILNLRAVYQEVREVQTVLKSSQVAKLNLELYWSVCKKKKKKKT